MTSGAASSSTSIRPPRDRAFVIVLWAVGGSYLALLGLMLLADLCYTTPASFWEVLCRRETRFSIWLTVLSCTLSAIVSVWIALPLAYLLSRFRFRGRALVDAALEIPVVLPPLVIGLSLLILFSIRWPGLGIGLNEFLGSRLGWQVTFAVPAVILAQVTVAAAYATRTLRAALDEIGPRAEQVAMTLGCSRFGAVRRVVLPQLRRGLIGAFTVAWARSLGEFGPILVFAGNTPFKTEVLSTSVFLELSTGQLEAAVAISLLMVAISLCVLLAVRVAGGQSRDLGR